MEYKCPYCGKNSYASNSNKSGKFLDWISVSRHTSKCAKNNNEYFIDKNYGPIHVTYILITDVKIIKKQYPKIQLKNAVKNWKKYGLIKEHILLERIYSKEEIISKIQELSVSLKRIPQFREFNYCSNKPILKLFGSWNNALIESGLTPSLQSGFGIKTYGLDGNLYRSQAEAYFADTYLYNKYNYIVEPKYDNNIWLYDWYIKELDLYIELDGQLRPERIKEKIEYNNFKNIKCLFINTTEIYNDRLILSLLNSSK